MHIPATVAGYIKRAGLRRQPRAGRNTEQEVMPNYANPHAPARGAAALPCPGCGKTHRSWYRLALCYYARGTIWISGSPPADGPCFATVSSCRSGRMWPFRTVMLHETLAEALAGKRAIDR